jgi:hypothetical protein
LVPLTDVVTNFPSYLSMVKSRFPTGHATPEQKAKLMDDLRRLQVCFALNVLEYVNAYSRV